ncbi:MAG: hypothetical protein HRT88_21525, partial [Lentisphaeraceae bacterium]|nr:hypothetical protein [Lentisphaeraceae bacterium]
MDLSYAERLQQSPTLQGFDAFANNIRGHLGQLLPRESYYARKAVKVLKLGDKIAELNDLALKLELETYRAIAACNNLSGEKLIMATALVSEAAARSMKMKPYKVQVTAVLCLQDGCISEMATGEGKSLTAAITAVLIGFKGRGCHVMTSNSYLACRDAEEFTPLFTFCGLSVASLDEECQGDDRRLAYSAGITYCTNKDVAAAFLRAQI